MGLKRHQPAKDEDPFRKLAVEVLDLSLFAPETGRKFEADQESDTTYCFLLSVLSAKRPVGLGVYWDEDPSGPISLLALAVEDAAVLLRTHMSGDWLPEQVKILLTDPTLPKVHAGDSEKLKEKLSSSFSLSLSGELDARTQVKSPQDLDAKLGALPVDEGRWSSEELESKQADAAAKRALLCWRCARELQPKVAAQKQPEPKNWAEHCVVRRADGLYCWACQAGPVATDADMQKHVDAAPHKRKLVLAGVLQDDQILPAVPSALAARGIALERGKEGALQYVCQKCQAGPFPTLDSVDSHLQGAKHLHKEGREPEVQFTADLAKEGFTQSSTGEIECRRCQAGPFKDRQSLRLHRQSLKHRDSDGTAFRPPRMERELGNLPGYCQLLGSAFCCFLCDVSAASLDGILQHLAGKGHRKACLAHGQPEPMILCKDLVCDQVSSIYPLQGRLRDSDYEPIFRKSAEVWLAAGPSAKKPITGPATSQSAPYAPGAMVSKEDVVADDGAPDFLCANMGDKVVVVTDEDEESPFVWAEIDEKRGWFPRKSLVKKLPPWKLSKARSKLTAKANAEAVEHGNQDKDTDGATHTLAPEVAGSSQATACLDKDDGLQMLFANAGDQVDVCAGEAVTQDKDMDAAAHTLDAAVVATIPLPECLDAPASQNMQIAHAGDKTSDLFFEAFGNPEVVEARSLSPAKPCNEPKASEQASGLDFELRGAAPQMVLDELSPHSSQRIRNLRSAEDVTEALLRALQRSDAERQMSASKMLRRAIDETSRRLRSSRRNW